MAKGLFIVLEGIDGAGTTTQGGLLARWLEAQGHRVALTAEPTTGPVGSLIREILRGRRARRRDGKDAPVGETTMALLFAADRADHLQTTILPALEAGEVAISDRHYLSSIAYQGLGVDMEWVEQLNSRFRRPDLTILLDIEPEVSVQRKRAQGAPLERYEHVAALERVRANYSRAVSRARAAGERIETLDGSQPMETVERQIRELVAALFPPEGAIRE